MLRAPVLLLLLGACAASRGRLEADVTFARYSGLSRTAEVARRALPPLTYRGIQASVAAGKHRLAEQSIDLSRERFDVYVPGEPPPPAGYGLVVFIAPWSDPTQPRAWRAPLDRHRLVFVAARDSGNDRHVLDRRLPLALLALENVRARFRIDARRVYVMGFSGGSRVAEIAALAYPDVFRGAILNAGADPIDGQEGIYKPPADLFRAFQRSRLVFITGSEDEGNLRQDEVARASLREACVLDVATRVARRTGHQPLDAASLDEALDALEAPPAVDAAELARCNARVEREIAAELAGAAAAIARGERGRARQEIKRIDARFGGLAARGILALDDQLAGSRSR